MTVLKEKRTVTMAVRAKKWESITVPIISCSCFSFGLLICFDSSQTVLTNGGLWLGFEHRCSIEPFGFPVLKRCCFTLFGAYLILLKLYCTFVMFRLFHVSIHHEEGTIFYDSIYYEQDVVAYHIYIYIITLDVKKGGLLSVILFVITYLDINL